MFSFSYLAFIHTVSLCPTHTHTHTPHVYPVTGAPRPSLQAQKPNLFIPVGIMGRGEGGEMHLTERRGPSSKAL